ncbi:hypothetical protein SDAV_00523 [Spiroplasma phoeniceum P40]|uniref:Uncharacterized protein n=1 Tax=Spiroplasma phoeniceum P40 TaxID=1276259 RepID=A0A345DMS9_9MOLU|nr:hypothetical protein SDAV_00523 [Spiroplasma phoeniceum P40]
MKKLFYYFRSLIYFACIVFLKSCGGNVLFLILKNQTTKTKITKILFLLVFLKRLIF